jgi:hypothetical protein
VWRAKGTSRQLRAFKSGERREKGGLRAEERAKMPPFLYAVLNSI